ncbi:MAG: chloride channel protein [Acidobacteriia bacterium]|nr:chloride channel protein [Terriglobia bacterium]
MSERSRRGREPDTLTSVNLVEGTLRDARLFRKLSAMHASSQPAAPWESIGAWRTRIREWSGIGLQQHEDKVLLLLTLIIGALVGVVVAGFIYVTENLGSRMYPAGGAAWRRLLIPTIGAIVTGYFLSRSFPNARGSGIPQTKAALFLRDGFISFRTVLGKFMCSSISLASGIALGREGPSVHIGAGLASVLGRRLGLGSKKVRELIPVGASAALAAAFNTPVAAVLFSLEEVMGDLHAPVLGSIVLSSATSWIVLHLLLGDEPLFHVPSYQLVSPVEFISYAVLGVVGGLVSVAFVKLLLLIRKRFQALPEWTNWMQPAAGGLLVGVLGWFVPDVLGVGYGHVSEALNGQMALQLMALLVVLKLVATAACYGTGNAGGIFGPSLFIGAMMGGAVGTAAHQLMPDYTGGVGAYALVGMGAAFAGIVRVPLTSVIMIFEMTRDYSIIVPLMISNLISYYISYKLQKEPIYEALQHQDGLHLPAGARDREPMPAVRDAATAPPSLLNLYDRFADALARLSPERNAWPVVAEHQRLLGMVSLALAEAEVAAGRGHRRLSEVPTAQIPTDLLTNENFPHVHLDHTLDVALKRMAESKWNVLPVVSRSNVRELQGVVSLHSVLEAYGIGDGATHEKRAATEEARPSRLLVPGVIATALVLLLLIGFLNYYYRSQRSARADQSYQAGIALERQDLEAEAVEQFRHALSVSPGNPTYRLALGVALVKTGQMDDGAVYLRELLKRQPENGAANLGLARIAASRQDTLNAITNYHRAIDGSWPKGQEPYRIQARLELAEYLAKQRLKTQAIAELLAAVGPAVDKTTRKQIGGLLLAYGSPRQSAEVFRDVLRADNQDAEAYSGLGVAQLALDNYLAARDAFSAALRLNPSDAKARTNLETCGQILALDPDARGIRSSERYRRSQTLLEGALKLVEQCTATVPSNAHPTAQTAESARKALAQHPRASGLGDATEENLTLAAELWRSRQPGCPAPAASDEALARVLAHLSHQ